MKNNSIIATLMIVATLIPSVSFAQILPPVFLPGQELNPSCAPGEVVGGELCTTYPLAIGAFVASGLEGSVPFVDSNGVFQQNNENLKWDENLKQLILSQGLPVGSLNVQNEFDVGSSPTGLFVDDGRLYVANSNDDTVSIVDISVPYNPTTLGTVSVGDNPVKILKSGSSIFVANLDSDTVSVIVGTSPAFTTASVNFANASMGFEIIGNYLYTTTLADLVIIDISNPSS